MELIITNKNYTSWTWVNPVTREKIESHLNPKQLSLFNGDIVDENAKIISSPVRIMKEIPCILDYKGSTHGRINDKLMYRCIPNDKTLPDFIVPYQCKTPNFQKLLINKYVIIQFKEWKDKHPQGMIINTIGDVDNNNAFIEYQLYCKKLIYSLKDFSRETLYLKSMEQNNMMKSICNNYYNIEDRTHLNIFSIDPSGCKDIDDAIGIQENKDNIVISVYIANVGLIVDYLKLWNYFTKRVSTIYLPTNNQPMLPVILSDNLCSLHQDQLRVAFAMDIILCIDAEANADHKNNNKYIIKNIEYKSVLVKLHNNYAYEENKLLEDMDYRLLFDLTINLNNSRDLNRQYLNKITDSHELVEYYMIFMNHECSKKMYELDTGIFRSVSVKEIDDTEQIIVDKLSSELSTFIKNWKYSSGNYCSVSNISSHELIGGGLDTYTHITSPIRRLVDTINITLLQHKLGLLTFTDEAIHFCNKWMSEIDFINRSMKSIKRIQSDSVLLISSTNGDNKKIYSGYLFDREELDNDKSRILKYKYNVYIPELKIISTIKTSDYIDNYNSRQMTIHKFLDEAYLKQKIRLQLC